LWLTLSFLVSKCLLVLTSILRLLLHLVNWFTNIALSPGDLDEVSGKAFAAYFQTSFLTNTVVASLQHDIDKNTVLIQKNSCIEVSYSTVLSDASNRTRLPCTAKYLYFSLKPFMILKLQRSSIAIFKMEVFYVGVDPSTPPTELPYNRAFESPVIHF